MVESESLNPRKAGKVRFVEVEEVSSKLLAQALNQLQLVQEASYTLNCLAGAKDKASLVYYLQIESSRVEQC